MKNKKFESGQIFVFLVIAMVALLGFTALAIDGSLIYNQKRQDQSTADSAALAGAASAARYINSAKSFTCDSTVTGGTAGVDVAAKATAASVGSSTVTFTCGTDATTGKQYLDIHTVVTSTVKTYFLKIVSSQAQTTTAGATARVTPGTSGPLFGGSALVSLSTSGCGMNFVHSVITLKGGGLFDNSSTSTGDGALCSDWGPTIVISDTGCIGVVGSLGSNFTNSGSNTKTGYCSPMPTQLAKTDTDKIFAKILLPSNTPTCSTPGVWDATNRVATAGDFSSTGLHLTSSGGTLNSGTYCFGSTGSFVVYGGSVTTT